MLQPAKLHPMFCTRCQYPVPAQPDEAAWVCSQCGQGLLLSDEQGLVPLVVHYSAALVPGKEGKPYWVSLGSVKLGRSTYQGDQSKEMATFWAQPRRFFVPAYNLPLEQLVEIGTRLLVQPPVLQETNPVAGSPIHFVPATYSPRDVRPQVEFIILGIEAGRKDWLRELRISLELADPELWILP